MAETCRTCKFNGGAYSYSGRPDEAGVKCRRHPPVATGGMMSEPMTIWPLVMPTDWCGYWQGEEEPFHVPF